MINQLSSESLAAIQQRIGGEPQAWITDEIGDGNVNLIFRLKGPAGQVLVKKAVPYLRCVGESWPLSMKRNFFEYNALNMHAQITPQYLPKVFAFDNASAAMVMEFLGEHIILRKEMMARKTFPRLAAHVSEYMAKTLFFTSDLYLSAAEKKERMKLFCENVELCKITEELIFTDPYRLCESNRWTAPQLDSVAARFREDIDLQIAITEMKAKFLTSTEALIHGDLHSGSIMVNSTESKVIDPEFAFYGPMGFDLGLYFGNFLLSYFSQVGHGGEPQNLQAYEEWILSQVVETWSLFSQRFTALWNTDLKGDYLAATLVAQKNGNEVLQNLRDRYMRNLFADSIRFAAAEMIRRILGLAHVADMDTIVNADLRAQCEMRALEMAREMLVNHHQYLNMNDILKLARQVRTAEAVL